MHACGEGFQPYFEDMTDEEGIKMALSIYGDIGFRYIRSSINYEYRGSN